MQKTHQCSMALASIYGSMVKTFTWPASRLASLVMRSLTSSKQLLDYMGAVMPGAIKASGLMKQLEKVVPKKNITNLRSRSRHSL